MVASGVSENWVKRLLATNGVGNSEARCVSCHIDSSNSNPNASSQENVVRQTLHRCFPNPNQELIVKPDQMLKRRGKLGLIERVTGHKAACDSIVRLASRLIKVGKTEGFLKKFIVEPFVEHDSEYYVCIYSKRECDVILFNLQGGIDIGDVDESSQMVEVKFLDKAKDLSDTQLARLFNPLKELSEDKMIIISDFINKLYKFYHTMHFEYLEINPFTILPDGKTVQILDCAAKVDPCASFLCKNLWTTDKDTESIDFVVPFGSTLSEGEKFIEELDSRTGASLKFTLINAKGRIWTLVAGGGASVVYADTICDKGYAHELANYGEYSGAPKTNEVYQYTKTILSLMLAGDPHPNGKILLIGGGIANFTNIAVTFEGIILAFEDYQQELIRHSVQIYVRRGGPNYIQGLQRITKAGNEMGLDISVYGPEVHMTSIISLALKINNQVTYLDEYNRANREALLKSSSNGGSMNVDKPLEVAESNVMQQADQNFPNASNILMQPSDHAFIIGSDKRAIQSMLDFDYKCGRESHSVVAIVDPFQSEHNELFFSGNEIIHIPSYKSVDKALLMHSDLNFCINMASMRSCYQFTKDLILNHSTQIRNIVIIAEGVPDNQTRHLIALSHDYGVNILGPATSGGIKPSALKIANTGGGSDQFTSLKLYTPGSVGIVTKSGGLSSEMMNIVSRCTDGVFSCVAIGGDRYPCLKFIDIIAQYQADANCKIILMIGEIGGVYELEVVEALKSRRITKPLIAWCIGTCSDLFKSDIQFGHAGAYAQSNTETALAKNIALRDAGAYVPESFEEIPQLLSEVYAREVRCGRLVPRKEIESRDIPLDFNVARSLGLVRRTPSFQTSITDERGNEVLYNNVPLSQILQSDNSIGLTIGHLWFKKDLPSWARRFIELSIPIIADHGPCVSGAQNTIVASRAGKDLISSLASGLLTIGSKFGGAMDQAARDFYDGFKNGINPQSFVDSKKKAGQRVMGCGHVVKSIYNPDSRVELLLHFVNSNFPTHQVLDYAQSVSRILLTKKQNLILNVDGAIGAAIVDLMLSLPDLFTFDEIDSLIDHGIVNGFFVLSRTIGLIGHYLDQKRLKQGLYRHQWDDIAKTDN